MKIGYRAGFRDGKEEGYQQGWEECQVQNIGRWRQEGFANALALVRAELLSCNDAKGVAGVIVEIEKILAG